MLQNSNGAAKIVGQASEVTSVAWGSIDGMIDSIAARLPYLLAGVLVLGLFYIAGKLVKAIFWAASSRTRIDDRLRILFARLIVFSIVVVGIFTSLTVVVPSFTFGDMIAGLGFTSFVIGFATKDILNNLLSGMLILWQHPFTPGDHIFVGSNQGKVEYIGVRATSLRKDDGELVLIPNGEMYSSALIVRRAGSSRRMSIKLFVGFDADLARVKQICRRALDSVDRIKDNPKPTTLLTDIAVEGIGVTVSFWINTTEAKPQEVFDQAAISVIGELRREGIAIYDHSPPDGKKPAEVPAVKKKVDDEL